MRNPFAEVGLKMWSVFLWVVCTPTTFLVMGDGSTIPDVNALIRHFYAVMSIANPLSWGDNSTAIKRPCIC